MKSFENPQNSYFTDYASVECCFCKKSGIRNEIIDIRYRLKKTVKSEPIFNQFKFLTDFYFQPANNFTRILLKRIKYLEISKFSCVSDDYA